MTRADALWIALILPAAAALAYWLGQFITDPVLSVLMGMTLGVVAVAAAMAIADRNHR